MSKYSAIAVGGPKDGQIINADMPKVVIPTHDGGGFTYVTGEIEGQRYWGAEDTTHSDDVKIILARYGEFRDFASGKTHEVMQAMSDRIAELDWKIREQADAKRSNTIRKSLMDANQRLAEELDEIKRVVMSAVAKLNGPGIGDEGMLLHKRVEMAIALRDGIQAAYNALEGDLEQTSAQLTIARGDIVNVKGELKSAGHASEGAPIDYLVDRAIDKERERHNESLITIGSALGVTFAYGSSPSERLELIANLIERLKSPQPAAVDTPEIARAEAAHEESSQALRIKRCEARIKALEVLFHSLNRESRPLRGR